MLAMKCQCLLLFSNPIATYKVTCLHFFMRNQYWHLGALSSFLHEKTFLHFFMRIPGAGRAAQRKVRGVAGPRERSQVAGPRYQVAALVAALVAVATAAVAVALARFPKIHAPKGQRDAPANAGGL